MGVDKDFSCRNPPSFRLPEACRSDIEMVFEAALSGIPVSLQNGLSSRIDAPDLHVEELCHGCLKQAGLRIEVKASSVMLLKVWIFNPLTAGKVVTTEEDIEDLQHIRAEILCETIHDCEILSKEIDHAIDVISPRSCGSIIQRIFHAILTGVLPSASAHCVPVQ